MEKQKLNKTKSNESIISLEEPKIIQSRDRLRKPSSLTDVIKATLDRGTYKTWKVTKEDMAKKKS